MDLNWVDMEFEFNLRTKTKFGVGSAKKLGHDLGEMSLRRIGIIIDSGISNLDYSKEILKSVQEGGFEYVKIWEYSLNSEPDYDSLDRVKNEFLDGDQRTLVDCFVGIGGGSVIDFAKGLATIMVNPGNAIEYRGFPKIINPSLPTIAIPTTAGTGSEVTYNAVFIDWNENKKLGINTMENFPVLAILDPLLTVSCPKSVTVSSGMDALVHCMGSYSSVYSNPVTRMYSKEAFSRLFNNLYRVLDNPSDINIRAEIQLGAYLAGVALFNSGSDPSGALSYPLGVLYKVPHGLAGSVFLPYIVAHNESKGFDYSELNNMIDIDEIDTESSFSYKINMLCQKLGIPEKLSHFGINNDNVDNLIESLDSLKNAFAQNSVDFYVEDAKKIILSMIDY